MSTNTSDLNFVLHHYQENAFDPEAALRRFHGEINLSGSDRTLQVVSLPAYRHWMAVAASLLCLVALAALVQWQLTGAPSTPAVHTENVECGSSQPTETVKQDSIHPVLRFDNTPLPQVLRQLGQRYGVVLSANDTDKRLTGDFTADSLSQTIMMIEEVIGVKIKVEKQP